MTCGERSGDKAGADFAWRHQMEHFPCHWPLVRGIHWWFPSQRPMTEFWCFIWSAFEQTVEQTIKTLVIETPSRSLWRKTNKLIFWPFRSGDRPRSARSGPGRPTVRACIVQSQGSGVFPSPYGGPDVGCRRCPSSGWAHRSGKEVQYKWPLNKRWV